MIPKDLDFFEPAVLDLLSVSLKLASLSSDMKREIDFGLLSNFAD
jgi:hypothetical protein